MKITRRSKILYPFECHAWGISGRHEKATLYARNRREAKRHAQFHFKWYFGPVRAYHMPDKPLAIPVKE